MIRTIVVDDDPKHLESLQNLLVEHFKQVEVVATSGQVPEAVKIINDLKPELVFLDIEMGSFTGFDLLEMVADRDFEVIFTTSYQQYAIRAIKASALDYIEKPVDKQKLAEALLHYRTKTGQARLANLLENFRLPPSIQRVALPDTTGMHFFETSRIICCQTNNSYTHFVIKSDGTDKTLVFTVSKGLSCHEDFLLEKGFFFRVHLTCMVNVNYIKKLVKGDNAYLVVEHIEEHIPIARDRKADFIRFLKNKGIAL